MLKANLSERFRTHRDLLPDAAHFGRPDGDPEGDARLKRALKRAVAKTDAPAYLIDAIRREIRK